jgi:hypothetical protein
MGASAFDGLFLCLRSQSKPAAHADQFDQQGEFLTLFLRELRTRLRALGKQLAVGAPRGDLLGPPFGNVAIEWREWVGAGLLDALVINQNSSQCPSMWHQLWPMHRGRGYRQDYLSGAGLPPLAEHIRRDYSPVMLAAGVPLFIACQWDPRDPVRERQLLALPGVTGLVFSSFRHDNPAAVKRNDWRF